MSGIWPGLLTRAGLKTRAGKSQREDDRPAAAQPILFDLQQPKFKNAIECA
jgi:hypothetical protein